MQSIGQRVSSNRIVDTAALTLRESTREAGNSSGLFFGMVSTISESRARLADTPLPSEPISTSLLVDSPSSFLQSWRATRGILLLVCLVPVHITLPCCLHLCRKATGSLTECTSISYIAPELVLLTVEFSGHRFLLPTIRQPIWK